MDEEKVKHLAVEILLLHGENQLREKRQEIIKEQINLLLREKLTKKQG